MRTAGGSNSRQRHRFTADGGIPGTALNLNLGVTRELSDGWRRNTPQRSTRIHSRLGYSGEDGTDVGLSYTHVADKLHQAGTLTRTEMAEHGRRYDATPGDFTANDSDLLALNLRRELAPRTLGSVQCVLPPPGKHHLHRQPPFFPSGPNPEALSDKTYNQGGGTVQLTHSGMLFGRVNRLNAGVDYRRNRSAAPPPAAIPRTAGRGRTPSEPSSRTLSTSCRAGP